MTRARFGAICTGLLFTALSMMSREAHARTLTVCADPNNLPFSNRERQGFENEIAALLAHELSAELRYVWWAQRRGYARNTLNSDLCDLWAGVASGVERIATTAPYYRSSYMFVTRADRNLQGLTLDDPRLRTLALGVQLIGDDAVNTPPAHALARRDITDNVHGFMLYGDYRQSNPSAAIVDAVARGEIDVGLVWGPVAGYFSQHAAKPLRLEPITPVLDGGQWPMAFDVGVGVRRSDAALRAQIEAVLQRDHAKLEAILKRYGVPLSPRAD